MNKRLATIETFKTTVLYWFLAFSVMIISYKGISWLYGLPTLSAPLELINYVKSMTILFFASLGFVGLVLFVIGLVELER